MRYNLMPVIGLAMGTVFLRSAVGKARHPVAFARSVVAYDVLPPSLAFSLGLLLIPVEAILGFAHLTGLLFIFVLPIGIALLLCFAVVTGQAMLRGLDMPCHCFGVQSDEPISISTLSRLALLIAAEILLLISHPAVIVTWNVNDVVLSAPPVVLTLIAAMWLLRIPDLVQLARRRPTQRSAGQVAGGSL
jgi:hypothetical protein